MTSADTITLSGLRAWGYHGVFAEERRMGQVFGVDACLELDLRRAAATDHLDETVSYAEIATVIEGHITGEPLDLIEALAQRIALGVLGHDVRIQAVTITVHKPGAPLTQDFSDVSVQLRRTRAALGAAGRPEPEKAPETCPAGRRVRAVLALGSNLSSSEGGPEQILRAAVDELTTEDASVTVRSISPVARTAPVGGPPGQPDFLNMVVAVDTVLTADELLDHTQSIENAHGRQRGERWAARTLDIDIITYGEETVATSRLQIPHPRAAERAFVLAPWSWMEPAAVHRGRLVGELAAEAVDAPGVQPMGELPPGSRRPDQPGSAEPGPARPGSVQPPAAERRGHR